MYITQNGTILNRGSHIHSITGSSSCTRGAKVARKETFHAQTDAFSPSTAVAPEAAGTNVSPLKRLFITFIPKIYPNWFTWEISKLSFRISGYLETVIQETRCSNGGPLVKQPSDRLCGA